MSNRQINDLIEDILTFFGMEDRISLMKRAASGLPFKITGNKRLLTRMLRNPDVDRWSAIIDLFDHMVDRPMDPHMVMARAAILRESRSTYEALASSIGMNPKVATYVASKHPFVTNLALLGDETALIMFAFSVAEEDALIDMIDLSQDMEFTDEEYHEKMDELVEKKMKKFKKTIQPTPPTSTHE